MKNRIFSFIVLVSVIVLSLQIPFLLSFNAYAADDLGSLTDCKIVGDRVIVSGSIKHSVLVANRESTIGVYKFLPWESLDQVISSTEPLKVTNMSISFSFELPCLTIADKTSMYAVVLLDQQGKASCIASPKFPDAITADTSGIGFKGVKTDNSAVALASHAGSAIVDVYLDKLDKGNKSGHIFNADGDIYYFDRELIKQLDKQILSYTAMGCEVILRFLISPGLTNLPFCSDGRIWSTNKCVVVDDISALNAIYGYTYFLMSRYDGGDFGKVSGIILGRGADMPILYNYASLVSEDYDIVYARSLALVGLAAVDATGDNQISLIVPIGDSLTEKYALYAERFLTTVADYISSHSKLTFTIMCESIHNPYHINDEMFAIDTPPDESDEFGETVAYPDYEELSPETREDPIDSEIGREPETSTVVPNYEPEITVPEDHTEEFIEAVTVKPDDSYFPNETVVQVEDTAESEKKNPELNTKYDGFYCTDSLELFTDTFAKLKKKYNSLNDGFAWCWYPGEDTLERSLGICYSYNYMKLASESADFFVVAFEGDAADRFQSLSHIFKNIDTTNNIKETDYVREFFAIEDWSDIISGHVSATGVFNVIYESELQPNISGFIGNLEYMDYSKTSSVSGWFEGVFCNSIVHQTEDEIGYLQADLGLNEAGFDQAEIGFILKSPEPLLLGDMLTFDIKCGDNDGSLYEISIYINCGNSTIVSKAVIAGGVRSALSVNAKDIHNDAAVLSMRIALNRITGSGDCKLNLYSVSINSETIDDEALRENFQSIRDYFRSDAAVDGTNKTRQIIVTVILLSAVALFFVSFALANDRRLQNNSIYNKEQYEKQKGKRYERH